MILIRVISSIAFEAEVEEMCIYRNILRHFEKKCRQQSHSLVFLSIKCIHNLLWEHFLRLEMLIKAIV